MKYSIKLLESDSTIRKMMLQALQEEVDSTIRRAIPEITKDIQAVLELAIRQSSEYQSLIDGRLKLEFGLVNSQNQVDTIINTWLQNVNISMNNIKITNNGLSGGFSLGMVASDFSDVLSLGDALMTDTERGYSLPWLQWLLLEGGRVLVKDYKVVLGPNPYSRTGYAMMRSDSSSNWRVPPEFAGTISNNWIIRAIDSLSDKINNIIIQQIEKAIL